MISTGPWFGAQMLQRREGLARFIIVEHGVALS